MVLATQILHYRGRSLWFQRCDFRTAEKPFLLTTAAQNIPVFLRKLPLLKEHFFEWLKTANFSTTCETATLKSPPPRAFSAPRVHPRPRKRLARCTLDCGFKTPESPALRGFEAERCPITGTSLYLAFFFVLEKAAKSAGNAVIPTYPMHRSHGLQYLRHKRPTFAFTSKSGYTLTFANRIAHSGLHGETGAIQMGALLLPSDCFTRFGNPAWPGGRTANFAAFGSWSEALLKDTESLRNSDVLMRVAVPRCRGPAGLRYSVCNLVMLLFFHSVRSTF